MITSEYTRLGPVNLPKFRGVRVMMMPVTLHDPNTIPEGMKQWRRPYMELCSYTEKTGTGYLTIDERLVPKGETHRRAGIHVDGVREAGEAGGWAPPGGWGSTGMITASDVTGCRVYPGKWRNADVGYDGDCEHLRERLAMYHDLVPNVAYHFGPYTVHESLPAKQDTPRVFVRLSMPSDCPWYEGYTESPLGIKPDGPIHPQRKYMSA